MAGEGTAKEIRDLKDKITSLEGKITSLEDELTKSTTPEREIAIRSQLGGMYQALAALQAGSEAKGVVQEQLARIERKLEAKADSFEQKLASLEQKQDSFAQQLAATLQEEAVSFSSVGSNEARSVIISLGILIEDGQKDEPLPEPPIVQCGYLDMAAFADEEEATPHLLAHIKQGLEKNGVRFGRGGFDMLDLHKDKSLYDISVGGRHLKGGMDGGVVPFGVGKYAPQVQMRAGIELKHSERHKVLYKQRQGQTVAKEGQGTTFTGVVQGQTLIETLAACINAEYPEVILLLSDFDFNTLIRYRSGVVTYWENITFDQAMFKLAEYLKNCSAEKRYRLEQAVPSMSEQEVAAITFTQQLRKKLKPHSVLLEQLDSLTYGMSPDEKFSVALEFIQAHRPQSDDAWKLMFS